ncbi:MAG: hypothetical protein CBB96_05380 [Gammaproteobacteria bacterium TMED36]|nr:MAG: hypothetical protein CBB96_05380 [Gammaproteobacteria bacterium TMED36]|tara:strand:- start:313 stop:510 length:198 start_codon:yes stop_codon:yes gene_type:complete
MIVPMLWTLLLTVCFNSHDCKSQNVLVFKKIESCLDAKIAHEEMPWDGPWVSVTYECKPYKSTGV